MAQKGPQRLRVQRGMEAESAQVKAGQAPWEEYRAGWDWRLGLFRPPSGFSMGSAPVGL